MVDLVAIQLSLIWKSMSLDVKEIEGVMMDRFGKLKGICGELIITIHRLRIYELHKFNTRTGKNNEVYWNDVADFCSAHLNKEYGSEIVL